MRPKSSSIISRKFIQLLQLLEDEELKRFREYVHSPFFNKNKNVANLIDYLAKYHPNYAHLTSEKVFKQLFRGKAFREQAIKNLFTNAKKLLEGFLKQTYFERDEYYSDIALLKILQEKKADKPFFLYLKAIRQKLSNTIVKDVDFYTHELYLTQIEHTQSIIDNKMSKNIQLMQKINKYIDDIYIIQKLRYYVAALTLNQSIEKDNWQMPLLEEILAYLKNNKLLNIPHIALWYQLILLQKAPTEEKHYFELKVLLETYHTEIPKSELRQVYTVLFSYFHQKTIANQNNIFWLEEFHKTYKLGFEQGIFLKKNYIQPARHFRNCVAIAIQLKKYQWAKQFIETYQDKIPINQKENLVTYCTALLHFHQKEFDKCILLLNQYEFSDDFEYAAHKILLNKAYFESHNDYCLTIYSSLNSFTTFLKRHPQLPENTFLSYKNFCKKAEKLTHICESIKLRKSNASVLIELKNLKKEVENEGYLNQRQWFIEKIEERLELLS